MPLCHFANFPFYYFGVSRRPLPFYHFPMFPLSHLRHSRARYPEIASSSTGYRSDVGSLSHCAQILRNSSRVSDANLSRASSMSGLISEPPHPPAQCPSVSLFPPTFLSLFLSLFLFCLISRNSSKIPIPHPPSLSCYATLSWVLALFAPLSDVSFSFFLSRGATNGTCASFATPSANFFASPLLSSAVT